MQAIIHFIFSVVQYIDAKDNESYFNVDELPDHLKKKFSLLKSMRDFMLANLMLAGQVMYNNNKPTENEELERWPSISKWFVEERPELVASFCTSDGTFQVNFKQVIFFNTVSQCLKIYLVVI